MQVAGCDLISILTGPNDRSNEFPRKTEQHDDLSRPISDEEVLVAIRDRSLSTAPNVLDDVTIGL